MPVQGGRLRPDLMAPSGHAAAQHGGAALQRAPGLQPLHYLLEWLLHGAGARARRPHWADFEPGWLAEQQRGGER